MDMLRELVKDYSDEQLLEARNQRGEYTDEAMEIFEGEIAARGLDAAAARESAAASVPAGVSAATMDRGDFAPLPGFFTKGDLLIANAVLGGSGVLYTMEERKDGGSCDNDSGGDNSCDSDPDDKRDSSDDKHIATFNIIVHKDAQDRAVTLLNEHFTIDDDGRYTLLDAGIVKRLKAFGFGDIRMSDAAARERFDVDFSEHEKSSLVKLARLLIDEADTIEESQSRIIFFYDTLEPLAVKLTQGEQLTRTDFLAIIELCQIYCEDERYDAELNQTAAAILSFFLD